MKSATFFRAMTAALVLAAAATEQLYEVTLKTA